MDGAQGDPSDFQDSPRRRIGKCDGILNEASAYSSLAQPTLQPFVVESSQRWAGEALPSEPIQRGPQNK
jgi:hypothetical protein